MGDVPLNLFGEPVPERRSKRGRPCKAWTVENSRVLVIAAATGHSLDDAALALDMSLPTLRKYYFSELRLWDRAKLRLRFKAIGHLIDEMEKGNVAAAKEVLKAISRSEMPGAPAQDRGKAKQPKLGKKDQALVEAKRVGQGEDSQWSFLNNRTPH